MIAIPTPSNNLPRSILFPGTKYRILTLAPVISVGGSFFSMMHMSSSCIGFLDTFLQGRTPSEACRAQIQRITLWLASVFLDDAVSEEDGERPDSLFCAVNLKM